MALFRKKQQPSSEPRPPAEFSPFAVPAMLPEIVRAVVGDYASSHAATPETLAVTLLFDDQARVATISNAVADGIPFALTFAGVERINEVCRPWSAAPPNDRPRSLGVTVDHGRFSTDVVYPD